MKTFWVRSCNFLTIGFLLISVALAVVTGYVYLQVNCLFPCIGSADVVIPHHLPGKHPVHLYWVFDPRLNLQDDRPLETYNGDKKVTLKDLEDDLGIRFFSPSEFEKHFPLGWWAGSDPRGGKSILSYLALKKNCFPEDILYELGCEDESMVLLSEIFYLIMNQRDGGSGPLLRDDNPLPNKRENLFFVQDYYGAPVVVRVWWDDDRWSVSQSSLGNPIELGIGKPCNSRFFYRRR